MGEPIKGICDYCKKIETTYDEENEVFMCDVCWQDFLQEREDDPNFSCDCREYEPACYHRHCQGYLS